ncbi:MAG: hypothetical protein B7C54_03845 [Acidimicrobiales bacterium mtb01]|nr:hypothetical protein [Actinomycetota bacterium]TEX47420.1 MAG: hypothetical protein B7C54_03845 [Acidimicrobiales bacterium mtb01]
MKFERKRVAKRLASGLLAGALAFGGLALSGASPVAAETPLTNRIAGVDRYDTSVALALASVQTGPLPANTVDHIVLASGENFPDALAASGYAGSLTTGGKKSVVLLTRAGALPETVVNYLSNTANFSSPLTVRAIGGTSAISDAVLAEVKALTGVTATRVSGADRYATAVALSAAQTPAATKVIIVSGSSFADGVSAAGWAYKSQQPILLSGPNGLDTATKAEIKRLSTATPNLEVTIIGGTAAVPDQTISDLVDQGVKYAKINRIDGADRYETAVNLNVAILGNLGFDGSKVALITGTNFADAIAAAPYLGVTSTHTVLLPASGIPASVAGLAVALAPNNPASVVAIGGFAVIPNATVAAVKQAVADLGKYTTTLTAAEGATTATMSVTFPAGVVPVAGQSCAAPICLSSESASKWLGTAGNYFVNGINLLSFAGTSVTTAVVGQVLTATITLPAGFSVPGVTVSFPGIAEGAASDNAKFSISAASATIADDSTKPTLTAVSAVANSGAPAGPTAGVGLAYLLASEALGTTGTSDLVAADVSVKDKDGAAKCANVLVTKVAPVYVLGCLNPGPQAFVAGDVITINLDGIADVAGNLGGAVGAKQTITVGAADTAKPTLTRGAVTVTAATATTFALNLTSGTVTFSSTAASSLHGQAGLGWRLVLQSTSGNIPSVTVDAAAKRVVVTANFAKHTGDDIINAIKQNKVTKALLTAVASGAGGADGANKLATSYIAGDQISPTAGQSTTTIALNASEALNSGLPLNPANFTNATCSGLTVAYQSPALGVTVSCGASATPFSGNIVLGAGAVTDLVFNASDANPTGI